MKGGVRSFWLLALASILFSSCKTYTQCDEVAELMLPAQAFSAIIDQISNAPYTY